MDLSTIGGVTLCFVALCAGILLEGGNLTAYYGLSAAVIIFGGTIGAVITSFPIKTLVKIPGYLAVALSSQKYNVEETISIIVGFAEKARKEGILALEGESINIRDDFLRYGLELAIDGTDPELIRDTLSAKLTYINERHHEGAQVFEAAGGFAPTMGIIGTILGLINVLSNLEDASELGHSIALAFIATLYGVGSANVLWLPIAVKLKNKHKEEILVKELMFEGIISLQSGDNPYFVAKKLKALLADKQAKTIKIEGISDKKGTRT